MAAVFAAVIEPGSTTQVWFTTRSGRVAPGPTLTWTWEMDDVSGQIHGTDLTTNERIRNQPVRADLGRGRDLP